MLGEVAREAEQLLREFQTAGEQRIGGVKPGYGRVQAICDYVNQHLTFQYGTTTAWSTAADVHESGYGVCRDFTHLAVSMCRALNIPARYVFGYLPEIEVEAKPAPMDFAAWMEVYLGDRWYLFDPSGTAIPMGFVRFATGRDAADVAFATIFGSVVSSAPRIGIDSIAGDDGRQVTPRHVSQALSTDG